METEMEIGKGNARSSIPIVHGTGELDPPHITACVIRGGFSSPD